MKLDELLKIHGRPLERDRGHYLFRQGDRDRSLYYVKDGLLKAYYLSSEGKESTKSFLLPGDTIGSLKGILGDEGCSFNLVCLERSTLVRIEFDALYARASEDIELAGQMTDFLLAFGMKKENREFELLCLSPEERYQRLMRTTPQLFDLVTQNEIARYLGVTPVGLSRIKKRVQETA